MSGSLRWMLVLGVAAIIRSVVLGPLIPPYQSSDEPWHLDYARAIASGTIPVLGRTRLDPGIADDDVAVTRSRGLALYGIDNPPMSREATQPPLGYVLPAAGWLTSTTPRHALRIFRALDALIGAALAAASYWAGRVLFPEAKWAGVLAGLTAVLLPAVGIVASTANNDALATLLGVIVVGAAGALARRGGPLLRWMALGVGVGLAALTKSTGLVLMAPVVLAALISPAVRPQLRWTRAIVTAVPALALSGLWFWHNVAVYGDLAGTRPFSAFGAVPGEGIGGWRLLLAGRPTLPRAHRFWPEVFRTSVGVLRWSDLHLPPALYLIALVAGLAGLVSVGMWWRRSEAAGGTSSGDDRVLLVVGATLAAQVLGLVWFAMTVDYQPQGRYLLVGILASAAAVGAAVGPRRMAAAGLCLTALLASAVVTAATTFGLP